MTDRETSLWRVQSSFGWTADPDLDFSVPKHDGEGLSGGKKNGKNKNNLHLRNNNATKGDGRKSRRRDRSRRTKKPSPWAERAAQRGPAPCKMVERIKHPRPTRGNADRFLSKMTMADQIDTRYDSAPSEYFRKHPTDMSGRPAPPKPHVMGTPRESVQIVPTRAETWLHTQGLQTQSKRPGSPPPKLDGTLSANRDLASKTAGRHLSLLHGRRVFFTILYPFQLKRNESLHRILVEAGFSALKQVDANDAKLLGNDGPAVYDGCWVEVSTELNDRQAALVSRWTAPRASHLFSILQKVTSAFDILIHTEDFFILERAFEYCRTYNPVSMPTAQRQKLVSVEVSVPEKVPPAQAPPRPATAGKRRRRRGRKGAARRRPRSAKATQRNWAGPQFLSQYRSPAGASGIFGSASRSSGGSERGSACGPGSFITPSGMGKQIETGKRNPRLITSLRTKVPRATPLDRAILGLREGPGPKYDCRGQYHPSGMKFGPGFIARSDPVPRDELRRHVRDWANDDVAREAENGAITEEMQRLRTAEYRVKMLERGCRALCKGGYDTLKDVL